MKKYVKWWIQRFTLCALSITALIILVVYAGPRVGMQNCLNLDIVEQYADIEDILEERKVVTNGIESYEYKLMLVYYTEDTGYHRTFNVVTTYPLTKADAVNVKYYKKFPNTVYATINSDRYSPSDMMLKNVLFNLALFGGVPIGVYTVYFLKRKKKPRIQKKKKGASNANSGKN